MRNYRVFLSSILFLLSFLALQGQTIQHQLEKMDNYNVLHPQEKLYLQLDKYSYTAGETIWFKAYATIGISNLFSNHSGIAYVELIDVAERKIDSLVIPLVMGVGLGDIVLSDTITEGSYRIRAYTQWMRNDDKGYFYDRTIQVSNGRGDDVITSTVFNKGTKNNTVSISLKNLKKEPLINTKVRYEVIYKDKSVERKRGSTNEKGDLLISVPAKYEEVQLELRIQNTDNSSVSKVVKVLNTDRKNQVALLPEGGKIISGFVNTIGVKSINGQGLGEKVKLHFVGREDTLGVCTTNDLGMGLFYLIVNPDDSIRVFADYGDAVYYPVELPKIEKSGYGIQVNNQNLLKLYAQINISEDNVNGEDLYFVVHHLGKVFFVSKQKVNEQEVLFAMDKNKLPMGVITISILNNRFEPVVERAIFNYNKANFLDLDMALDKQSYGPREKVQVGMQVVGADTLKVSVLSAAVLNMSKIQEDPYVVPNILTSLLLSADLKGYIEKPGSYFEKDGFKSLDMDYLMLTQGWRNIDWKEFDKEVKPKYEVEKTLSISGYTKKLGRSKPEIGAKLQLISTKNFMDFIDTISNEEGYFNFDKLLFVDSVKFLIAAQDAKGKRNIDITYNRPIAEAIGSNKNWPEEKWDVNRLYEEQVNFAKAHFAQLEGAGLKDKAIRIEEVLISARKEPKVSKNSSNLNGPGRADQVITAEDLSTCTSLEMCLAGRLVGVYWQGGAPYNTRGNVPMQVVFDGMFVDPEQLSFINVSDVESIEVLRNANYTSIYGSNGGNGIIVITSKTGDAVVRRYTPRGIITIQPKGLHVNREFYKPKYDVADNAKYVRDLRTTIHWEPSIVTDYDGKASFEFFTADEKGKYLIVIEGLDLFGKICRVVKVITVE